MEQKERFLARGAEAVIIKKGRTVIKDRIEKSYRHPQLDEKLRSQRTRAEAKLLEKAHSIINVPKINNLLILKGDCPLSIKASAKWDKINKLNTIVLENSTE